MCAMGSSRCTAGCSTPCACSTSTRRRGFKKCARVVGDVIGKYHPHGDTSVYDALVRLAQDFAVRYPLVDGQGNFGNIDGDNAAAMRYTEARLTAVAAALMEGLEDDAVDYRATYDGEEQEPIVFPGGLPEPAGQWRQRHRGRHGDQHPAAQCRRAVRRPAAPDQVSQGDDRQAGRIRAGAGFPDRRHPRRIARDHPAGLQGRPRLVPRARQMGKARRCPTDNIRSSSPRFRSRCRSRV